MKPETYILSEDYKSAAELREEGTQMREVAKDNLEAMEKAYWEAHNAVLKGRYPTRWEQIEAIRKLSQLGLALHAAGGAYKAINQVHCI